MSLVSGDRGPSPEDCLYHQYEDDIKTIQREWEPSMCCTDNMKGVIGAVETNQACHSCHNSKFNRNYTEFQIYLSSSMKIGTTRGPEVTRRSHGWAHEVGG